MVVTPKVRSSMYDLGYIHNDTSNETVVFDCNPFESNIFRAQHKATFDNDEIRENLECSGSVLLEGNGAANAIPSDTIVHYHMLKNNRLMLFENNLTESLTNDGSSTIPNVVTFALTSNHHPSSDSDTQNQFLNLFYINTLQENVFMVFGTRCWLNIVTYKNAGEKSLLRPLINSNSFNFKGDRLFFHAGKKVSNLPDQNSATTKTTADFTFGTELIVDVRKMSDQVDTYKMIVFNVNKNTMVFYQIGLDSRNDLNLIELPYVYSGGAQGFAQRSISSIMSLLTSKPSVIAAKQLDDNKVVLLYSDNRLVIDDYSDGAVREEFYKETLPIMSINDSPFARHSNTNTSTTIPLKEQSNSSFIKIIQFDNEIQVFVHHFGKLYVYNYACDTNRWYVVTCINCPSVISYMMDCIVIPTEINTNSNDNDNNTTSASSPKEYALIIVGTTENDQVCYYCSYFYLRRQSTTTTTTTNRIELIEMIFVSGFELVENSALQVRDDIHKLLAMFKSVDEIHSYFLFKIFANSGIIFESIVRTLEKYGKSYGAINSVITHNNNNRRLITTNNIKSVLVEIVEKEIASKFGNVNCFSVGARSLGSTTSCMVLDGDVIEDGGGTPKFSPCIVALQVWQRIYMTILTTNTEISSRIYTIPNQLYHYTKVGGGCYILNTYDLCGLRLFSLLDSFELLKKNTHRRQPSNVILDCCRIIDIPDTYVVFKNVQYITHQINRMSNDLSLVAKSYTNNSDNHFKSVCDFFKQLFDTTSLSNHDNASISMVDIEKEHTDEFFRLFQLFIERDNIIARCYQQICSRKKNDGQPIDENSNQLDVDGGGCCILSKILNSHMNFFCWSQFLIASQLLMVYYTAFEREIECDVTLVPSSMAASHANSKFNLSENNNLLKYKTLVQRVHVLFNYYGQCVKLCTDWMPITTTTSSSSSSNNTTTTTNTSNNLSNESLLGGGHHQFKNSDFLAASEYAFNLQPLNDVLDGCHGVRQWATSTTPMDVICASYINSLVLNAVPTSNCDGGSGALVIAGKTIKSVINSFFTPLIAKSLYNSCHYEQTLFHCYSMIALCFQTHCFENIMTNTTSIDNTFNGGDNNENNNDGGCNKFNGYILQLQLYIARTYIKLNNYNSAKVFYKELLLTFINLMADDQLLLSPSNANDDDDDDEFFCNFLDSMISDFVNAKPSQPLLLLELVNIGLSAPIFKLSNALESTHSDVDGGADVNGNVYVMNGDNPTYNKLLHTKFMCYIHMADYRSALDLLSLFYCDMKTKLQKITTICNAIMLSSSNQISTGRRRLCEINFGEYLPLVISVLKEIIVDLSSHDLIIHFSKQACQFALVIELFELAAFFSLTAYYKLYDGCLLKYWCVDRRTIEAMGHFARTLHTLVHGGTFTQPNNAVKLPLFASHDEATIQLMINEFRITPKTLINLDDIEQMVVFCDTCLAIEHKLKTLQFLPGSFPLVDRVEMVKYLIKYDMFQVSFNYAYAFSSSSSYNDDIDLLQYVLNAIAIHEISVDYSDVNNSGVGATMPSLLVTTTATNSSSGSGGLQQCCYQIVADHKPIRLLCNLVRVYLAKQTTVPEWLEHIIAQNHTGQLIQTYLLELRLDKAAQWCAALLDNITANYALYSEHNTVNSYFYLAELTFTRLNHLVKHTADPSDAITMNVVLNRLNDSIRNYKKCIRVADSDIISNANSV